MSFAPTIEFWFDFASTYSYPAAMRVEAAAAAAGRTLHWRPFLLGPIFAAQGWADSPFNLMPIKGAYMWRDLQRICADLQLPFRRPSQFPRNSVAAARLACAHAEAAWLPDFVRAVYRANFAEDHDIADEALLRGLLRGSGAPAEAWEQAEAPERRARLRAQTAEAQQRGLFGAPSFTVARTIGGHEVFWGNDRLEAALRWREEKSA